MTLFTENPLEKMMVQRPTGRRDSAPPVPKSRRVCVALIRRNPPVSAIV